MDTGGAVTTELAGGGGCDETGGGTAEADGIAESVLAGRVDASGIAAVGACEDAVPGTSEVAGGEGWASDSAEEVGGTSLLAAGGAPDKDEEGRMYVLTRVELDASTVVGGCGGTDGV